MESMEIATMSSRGQIVIPQGVRDALSLDEGVRFLVVGDGDTIILKRLEVPSAQELRSLLTRSRRIAAQSKFKQSDLKKISAQERKKT